MSKYPNYILVLCIMLVLTAAYLLSTSSTLLIKSIPGLPNLPVGTIITWMGIIGLHLFIYTVIKRIKRSDRKIELAIKNTSQFFLVLSFLWGLISYGLAGTWSYNFGPKSSFVGSVEAGVVFWTFTKVIVAIPIVLLLLLFMSRVILLFLKK